MKYAIYCRVSSDKQEQERTIDSQIASIENFAKEQSFDLYTPYFLDDGFSGAYLVRPALDKLRDEIPLKQFEGIIFYDPDRLSRNYAHQAILMEEFEKQGLDIRFVTTKKIETDEDRIMFGMKGLFASYERSKILERTRRGRLHKVNMGNIMTSKAPYGFSYIPGNKHSNTQGYFVHNPSEIETLKYILKWAKEGISDRKIVKLLKAKDLKPRNGKEVWAISTIKKILSTNLSTYYGEWKYQKYLSVEPKERNLKKYTQTLKTSRKLRDSKDWINVSLPQLAIISKQDAEIITKWRNLNRSVGRNSENFYLLRKRVKHTNCNSVCYADSFHGNGYYRCADKRKKLGLQSACSGGSVKTELLDYQVWQQIKHLIVQPDLLISQAKYFVARRKDDGVVRNDELTTIQNKLADLDKENERVVTAFRENIISLEDLKLQKSLIDQKRSKLNQQLDEIKTNFKKIGEFKFDELTNDITSLCSDMATVLENLTNDEKTQLIKSFNIEVFWANHEYTLSGHLPLVQKNGHNTKTTRPVSSNEDRGVVIPFTLTGKLPIYINQHKIL